MAEKETVDTGNQEYLGMSDDAFLNIGLGELEPADFTDTDEDAGEPEEARGVAGSADDGEAGDDVDDPTDSQDADEGDDDDDDETSDADDEQTPSSDADSDDNAESGGTDDGDDSGTDDDADSKESDEPSDAVDPKTFYERVTAEFKANGRPMKVNNADDVIRLMQMGANYNRKMAALKPSLKVMKMLEKHELLSEEKLSFLIDLEQKNPAAIAKLLSDSNIDPLDFNLDQGTDYKASDYSVDDREIALDEVVEEIKDSPTYTKTINLVTQQWDVASKQRVANEPQLLKVLDSHMANGVYDRISTEVEQERLFGRLNGMSDLEAYTTVGDAIAARGGFDDLKAGQPSTHQTRTQQLNSPSPEQKAVEQKRRDKRRAASSTKPAAPSAKGAQDFNPLAMSDDEYMKQFDTKFL